MMKKYYPLCRLLSAAAAAIAGFVYVLRGRDTLGVVLPVMCVCFAAICVFSLLESRAAGMRGIAAWLPVLAAALLTLLAVVGTAVFFLR